MYECFLLHKRADGSQNNLRSAAYEALMELVKNSPKVSNCNVCFWSMLASVFRIFVCKTKAKMQLLDEHLAPDEKVTVQLQFNVC